MPEEKTIYNFVLKVSVRNVKSSYNRDGRRTKRGAMVIRETPTTEFKEAVTPTFLKTVSAFANYGTGRIVFGVNDNGVCVGIDDTVSSCLRIENMINDSLDPIPRYALEPDEAAGTVTLTVYEGPDKPYRSKGRAYRRGDSATIEVDRLEYGRLVLEGSNRTYDELPSARQDVSFSLLERKLSKSLGIEALSRDVLLTLGLLNKDGYTNAAALLADENDFPGVDIVRFGDSGDVIYDRETLVGISVLEQIDRAVEMFVRYYCYERVEGTTRKLLSRVPREAFREALANALVHRTWDVRANVQVALYENRIVVTSPGGLPSGLTDEQYLYGQISLLRNPVLAEVFFKLDYIEKFGTGITRIRRSYQGSVAQPVFDLRDGFISVTLPVMDAFEGTEDERSVLKTLGGGRVLARRAIEDEAHLSRARALAALDALVSKGAVLRLGEGRATRYARP